MGLPHSARNKHYKDLIFFQKNRHPFSRFISPFCGISTTAKPTDTAGLLLSREDATKMQLKLKNDSLRKK